MLERRPIDPSGRSRVLVLAPTARDSATIESLLERHGYDPLICNAQEHLCEQIDESTNFLIIAEEALRGGVHPLANRLREQPVWSDIPLLLLGADRARTSHSSLRWQLFEALGNVTILERPVRTRLLLSALRALDRARKRQLVARGYLDEIGAARADLEQKVVERTVALSAEMDERLRAETALSHVQRLDSLGQLTGGVAHDFNNLLQVMVGGIALLERHGGNPKRREEILSAMAQAGERGSRLVNQLLAFARRQPLCRRTLNPSELIDSMESLLRNSVRPTISLRFRIAPDTWLIQVDASQLEAAILNLVVNARDATPAGGSIIVSCENVTLSEGSPIAPMRGDFVRITVRDTGAGMDDVTREHAFEPFFTTKSMNQGTGLGLSQVHGFVHQSGGGVHLQSKLGVGTAVCMFLPRVDDDQDTEVVPTEAPEVSHGGRILVVEDEDNVALLTRGMLRELGYESDRLTRAEDALAHDLAGYRALLCDVITPGVLDGVETAKRLRKKWPSLPILLTTGFATSPERLADADLSLITKPFTVAQLSTALAKLLTSTR